MDEYAIDKLPSEKMAVFVAATTGDGEAPDNMKVWAALQRNCGNISTSAVLACRAFGASSSSEDFHKAR